MDDKDWDEKEEFWDNEIEEDDEDNFNGLDGNIDANNDETFGDAAEWNEDEHEELIARDLILSNTHQRTNRSGNNSSNKHGNSINSTRSDRRDQLDSGLPWGSASNSRNNPSRERQERAFLAADIEPSVARNSNWGTSNPPSNDEIQALVRQRLMQEQPRSSTSNEMPWGDSSEESQRLHIMQLQQQAQLRLGRAPSALPPLGLLSAQSRLILEEHARLQQLNEQRLLMQQRLQMQHQQQLGPTRSFNQTEPVISNLNPTSQQKPVSQPKVLTVAELESQLLKTSLKKSIIWNNGLDGNIDANNDETFGDSAEWNEDEHEELMARDSILSNTHQRTNRSGNNSSNKHGNPVNSTRSDRRDQLDSGLPWGSASNSRNNPSRERQERAFLAADIEPSVARNSNWGTSNPPSNDEIQALVRQRLMQEQPRSSTSNEMSWEDSSEEAKRLHIMQLQQQAQVRLGRGPSAQLQLAILSAQSRLILEEQARLQQLNEQRHLQQQQQRLQMQNQQQLEPTRSFNQTEPVISNLNPTSQQKPVSQPKVLTVDELERQLLKTSVNLSKNHREHFKHHKREPKIVPPQVQLGVIEKAKRMHPITPMHSDEFLQDRVPTTRDGFRFSRHSTVADVKADHNGVLTDKERDWLTRIQEKIQADYDDNIDQDYYYLLYFNRSSMSDEAAQKPSGPGVFDRRFIPRERLLYNSGV